MAQMELERGLDARAKRDLYIMEIAAIKNIS